MPGMTPNLQWVQGRSIASTQGFVKFREGFLEEEALQHRLQSMSHRRLGTWLSQGTEGLAGAQGEWGQVEGWSSTWLWLNRVRDESDRKASHEAWKRHGFVSVGRRATRQRGSWCQEGGDGKQGMDGEGTGRWPAGRALRPGGPGGGGSGREGRPEPWAGPGHLLPGISPLPTGAFPFYSCSKSGEDLFPSPEPLYSAFSFSNPVTLRLSLWLVGWLVSRLVSPPRQQEKPFPLLLDPRLWRSGGRCCGGGPRACSAEPLPCALARWVLTPHCLLQAIQGWDWSPQQSDSCGASEWLPPLSLSLPQAPGATEKGFGGTGGEGLRYGEAGSRGVCSGAPSALELPWLRSYYAFSCTLEGDPSS